jgi:hypothetical protein|nr:MAG TPA: hypothetical protein [Caudoviricetes sp.]
MNISLEAFIYLLSEAGIELNEDLDYWLDNGDLDRDLFELAKRECKFVTLCSNFYDKYFDGYLIERLVFEYNGQTYYYPFAYNYDCSALDWYEDRGESYLAYTEIATVYVRGDDERPIEESTEFMY